MLVAFIGCENTDSENCVTCIGQAINIKVINSNGKVVIIDSITIISDKVLPINGKKYRLNENDTSYSILGNPGNYSISVYNNGKIIYKKENITVNQWKEVTCDHPICQFFEIKYLPLEKRSKVNLDSIQIINFENATCG